MVAAVREGDSMRSVARAHDVSLSTVQWWLRRAGQRPLDHVDWSDRPPIPKRRRRTQSEVEDLVVVVRREPKETSDLGEYGARAIYRELAARGHGVVPAVRTIGRILERRGALDAGRRMRRPPPPPGWYLPGVAAGSAELDSFDTVEGLTFEGGLRIEVLNVVSLHGGLPGSWPQLLVPARTVVGAPAAPRRAVGRPPPPAGSARPSPPPRKVDSKPPSKTSMAAGKPRCGFASTIRRSLLSTSVPGAISTHTVSVSHARK